MTFATMLILAGSIASAAESVDLYGNLYSFTGNAPATRRLPDTALLQDPAAAELVQSCADGCSFTWLQAHPDLANERKLRELVAAGLLTAEGRGYRTELPVILGRRRAMVQQIVESHAPALAGPVAAMLKRLSAEIGNPEFLFHLLWSRVLDEAWQNAWDAAFPRTPGPPGVTWVIYPAHSHAVGTNYSEVPGNGSIAVTWSPQVSQHIRSVMQLRYDLQRAAWVGSVPRAARMDLVGLGLADASGGFRGFSYRTGEHVDRLLQQLVGEYARLVVGMYDYSELGRSLGLSPDSLLIIILHETAYEILRQLDASHHLPFPESLRMARDPSQTRALVSLKLVDSPQPEDEAMAMFMRLGGRGNAETVAAFSKVLESFPTKQSVWLYLGLSLYETGEYGQALEAFRKLARLAEPARDEEEARSRDWAHIWMGHMYDLLGDRGRAIEQYGMILRSGSVAQHAQYGIGPVTAGNWARERLKSPFTRR